MNSFFTYKDVNIEELIYPLDKDFWWSRIYEYPEALDLVEKDETILDLGTGLYHPFKYALLEKTENVYALDKQDLSYDNLNKITQIQFKKELDKSLYNKVKFTQSSMTEMPYEDNKFDKIFVISVLEHLEENKILRSLKEIKRVLKDDGRCYISLDYPTMIPEKFIELVNQAELEIDGEYDFTLDEEKCISSTYFGGKLYCYSVLLKKPTIQEPKKEIKQEPKPEITKTEQSKKAGRPKRK